MPQEKPKQQYQHQEYPRWVHTRNTKGELQSKVVADADEHKKHSAKGWKDTPADLPEEDVVSPDDQIASLLDENEKLRAQLAEAQGRKGKSKE